MNHPTKWKSGEPETICGKGAKLSETKIIRDWLPVIVKGYNIVTIADVGCGDMNWVQQVEWRTGTRYAGFDLANHGPSFDCTKNVLRLPYDMIMCIYVLNHLYNPNDVERSIKNFQKSGSTYLLATYNDIDEFPLEPINYIFHKEKLSGAVRRRWYYGIFEL